VLGRLEKTYKQWDYKPEKRAAFEGWEAHLVAVLASGKRRAHVHGPRSGLKRVRRAPAGWFCIRATLHSSLARLWRAAGAQVGATCL
jgi:hypothetical protein